MVRFIEYDAPPMLMKDCLFPIETVRFKKKLSLDDGSTRKGKIQDIVARMGSRDVFELINSCFFCSAGVFFIFFELRKIF